MDYFKGFTTDLICMAIMMAAAMLAVIMLGVPAASRWAFYAIIFAALAFFVSAIFNLLANKGHIIQYLWIVVAVFSVCSGSSALIAIGKSL